MGRRRLQSCGAARVSLCEGIGSAAATPVFHPSHQSMHAHACLCACRAPALSSSPRQQAMPLISPLCSASTMPPCPRWAFPPLRCPVGAQRAGGCAMQGVRLAGSLSGRGLPACQAAPPAGQNALSATRIPASSNQLRSAAHVPGSKYALPKLVAGITRQVSTCRWQWLNAASVASPAHDSPQLPLQCVPGWAAWGGRLVHAHRWHPSACRPPCPYPAVHPCVLSLLPGRGPPAVVLGGRARHSGCLPGEAVQACCQAGSASRWAVELGSGHRKGLQPRSCPSKLAALCRSMQPCSQRSQWQTVPPSPPYSPPPMPQSYRVEEFVGTWPLTVACPPSATA